MTEVLKFVDLYCRAVDRLP